MSDREKWDAKYREQTPVFAPHALVPAALAAEPPEGPSLELACGASGSALTLALTGRRVVAIDVSGVAIAQLRAEAAKRGVTKQLDALEADLGHYHFPPGAFSLVYAIHFWDPKVFERATQAVCRGGVLAWETFTLAELRHRPKFSARYCLREDEPKLPKTFEIVERRDLDDGAHATRRLIARRTA